MTLCYTELMMSQQSREKGFAILRIIFGGVWLVDAYFKWNPDFINNFVSYLTGNLDGQPRLVQGWINFWVNVVNINPHLFAIFIAIAETAIALSLLSGILSKWAMYGGIAMALIIWSTAEGFGGPYMAGSTDVGAAIIYVLVFAALILGRSWEQLNLGNRWAKR